jgi:hypothetical protein
MAGAMPALVADPAISMELKTATKCNTGPQARTRPRLCAMTRTLPTRTWPRPELVVERAQMSSRMPLDPRHRKVQVMKPAPPGRRRRPISVLKAGARMMTEGLIALRSEFGAKRLEGRAARPSRCGVQKRLPTLPTGARGSPSQVPMPPPYDPPWHLG